MTKAEIQQKKINEALPSESFSLGELEKFMRRLKDIGVRGISDSARNN